MCSDCGCWRCSGLAAVSDPVDRRAAELDEIEQFITGRGATSCRPAYAGVVKGALARREERTRIAALEVEKDGQSWKARNRAARSRRR
jgi:hypothetical protein